jgi:hypothetical protein
MLDEQGTRFPIPESRNERLSTFESEEEQNLISMLSLAPPMTTGALAFNVHVPSALLEGESEELPEFAAHDRLTRNAQPSTSPDGSLSKQWAFTKLVRFEAYGWYHSGLAPTCDPRVTEGIFMDLDVFGPLLGDWTHTWKTYARGSLGPVAGAPCQWQFHWEKPYVCGFGPGGYESIYAAFHTKLREVIQQIGGLIGKALDKLLNVSGKIAKLLAQVLWKWIGKPGASCASTTLVDMRLTSAALTVRRGSQAKTVAAITGPEKFSETVRVTVIGNSGSRVTVSPSALAKPGNVSITIRTAAKAQPGTYVLKVAAKGAGASKELPLTLTITT